MLLALKSLYTTGTIAAGSNQLALVSNPGFKAGDSVIVELGGEAGKGLRGTRGVGGIWPSLSYATLAALNAATQQTEGRYAWVEATGDVYRFQTGAWSAMPADQYYTAKAIPKALIARVQSVSGNTLTLSASAAVAATLAKVHFDNAPLINAALTDLFNIELPAGKFAVSTMLKGAERSNLRVAGSGQDVTILFSPLGTPSAEFRFQQCPAPIVRDFCLQGNVGDNGFGLRWGTTASDVTETNIPQGMAYPSGVIFQQLDGRGLENAVNLKVVNCWQYACGASFCQNVTIRKVLAVLTEPLRQYIQWQFDFADSRNCQSIDCALYSRYLTAGFEIFRSGGCSHIRPQSYNGTFAINSSGYWLVDRPRVTIGPMSQISDIAWSKWNPIFNVNANIGTDPLLTFGGIINNPRFRQEGFINARDEVMDGILIGEPCPNVQVRGGVLQSPDWRAPSTILSRTILIEGQYGIVDGTRIIGKAAQPWGSIHVYASNKTVQIRNCAVDVIVNAGGVNEGNVSLAAWATANPLEMVKA